MTWQELFTHWPYGVVVIEGLQRLTALIKLDLGKNLITRIENLAPHLLNLTQLSLEDNDISSLQGLAGRGACHTTLD